MEVLPLLLFVQRFVEDLLILLPDHRLGELVRVVRNFPDALLLFLLLKVGDFLFRLLVALLPVQLLLLEQFFFLQLLLGRLALLAALLDVHEVVDVAQFHEVVFEEALVVAPAHHDGVEFHVAVLFEQRIAVAVD